MIGRRNRTSLVLLIVMGLIILSVYYSGGGEKIIGGAQRQVISVLAPVHRLVDAVISPLNHGWNFIMAFTRMNSDNNKLRLDNLRLRHDLSELRQSRLENIRLKKLVGFQSDSKLETVPARVIGRTPSSWQAVLVIDQGENSGVKKNMPVVVDGGVVGQVAEASGSASDVLLLTDEKSGIGVQVERTGQLGVVEGRTDGELRLMFVPKDADIRSGDRLLTSGIGQVYPRGLQVGTIGLISESQYGMEKTIKIKPAVDFNKLEDVLVVINNNPQDSVRAVSAK